MPGTPMVPMEQGFYRPSAIHDIQPVSGSEAIKHVKLTVKETVQSRLLS